MIGSRGRRYGTLLSVVLALFLTMALAACSGEGDPGGEETPGSLLERAAEPQPTATGRPSLTLGLTSAATDREALVALYNATNGPGWTNNENWLSDAPLDEWYGVETFSYITGEDGGRVTRLELGENGLSESYEDDNYENWSIGEIPPELGNLANLEELWLGGNQLSGEIPPELGNLANLEVLSLGGNELTGEIPPELGNLANLESLTLTSNQLSGEIPPELGNLANLESLNLDNNELSGEIPPELGSLANLERLDLEDNQLSGEIPPELGNLANLAVLLLHRNELSGEIPPELGNLANLSTLYLRENQLSGCVPSSLEGKVDIRAVDGSCP